MGKTKDKKAFVFEIYGETTIVREGIENGKLIEKFVIVEKDLLSAFDVFKARFKRTMNSTEDIDEVVISVLRDVEI